MTDRELLELAAKAAGKDIQKLIDEIELFDKMISKYEIK